MAEGFMSLKKDELLRLADEYAVDVEEGWTKQEIVNEFAANGVNWEDYQRFVAIAEKQKEEEIADALEDDEDQDSNELTGERILLRMTRKNPTYELRGAKWTRERPFAFVSEEDAEWILENDEGFRPATPKEVREFYGK